MRGIGSNQKGDIAEVAIRLAATRAGIGAYAPTGGHSRADMLFEIGNGLYRVQIKWGRLSPDANCITSKQAAIACLRVALSAAPIPLMRSTCSRSTRGRLIAASCCRQECSRIGTLSSCA